MTYPGRVPIDVMMPFYGDVAQFRQAVTSVLDQSDGDLRLVVIDDCYPDPEPAAWLASVADPRIHYLRNETNLGVNGNFRRCVELVEAEYFVVMGCDDVLDPTCSTWSCALPVRGCCKSSSWILLRGQEGCSMRPSSRR